MVRTSASRDAVWYGVTDFLIATDKTGNSYGLRPKASTVRRGPHYLGPTHLGSGDSAEVMVYPGSKLPARVELAMRGWLRPYTTVIRTIAGMTSYYQLMAPFDRPDLVAVCADGTLLHAASNSGAVAWWSAGRQGQVARYTFPRPAVTQAHKRRAIVETQGEANARFFSPDDYPPWPKQMPAFENDGAWCLPTGHGVLEGTADAAGVRAHYLVARDGSIAPITGVPSNARVAGVSAKGVYFAVEAETGLFTIARYRLDVP